MSTMPRPPGSSDPDLWTLELPPSQDTSVGCMAGVHIFADGMTEEGRENEDRYYTCKLESIQLYAVLDGHNGSRACTFAQKHIPSLLLTCNMGENGEKAGEALKYTFENTEKHFFMMLDPSITRKMGLQMELQEQGGITSIQALTLYPDKVEELQRLDEQIIGGTTAVVALIINNRQLWVANVGDSRAVLCYLDGNGRLRAEQISEDHNTKNEKEIARLVACGLDEMSLRHSGRLGAHQNTRSIGDYSIKGGYKDHDILSVATREPGTAEPFISHPPLDITTIRGFLLLMSDGLYNAYASVTSSSLTVNHDVACLVQRHMDKTHSIDRVAQKVIDEISGEFRALVQREKRSDRMDDITLIVRNLGYPMGQQGTTLTAPPSLQNPFNFGQLPQQRAEMSTKHHYENSPFLSKQTSTAFQTQMSSSPSHQQPYRLATNYPKHFSQTHLHPTGQPLPSEMNTNSMFTATGQSQYPIHQPHPTGHNAQYPSSSSSSSPMRKSGSEPRVSLPPPGTHELQQQQAYLEPTTGYHGHQYPTTAQSDSSRAPLSPSTTATAQYENCDPPRMKRTVGGREYHHSTPPAHTLNITRDTADVTGNLAAVQVSPSVFSTGNGGPQRHLGPVNSGWEGTQAVISSAAQQQRLSSSLATTSTNAESQYQTPHQHGVLPPPVSSQTSSTSQPPTPNSAGLPTVPPVAEGMSPVVGSTGSVLMRRQSTVDDESWMYNQDAAPTTNTPPDRSSSSFAPSVGQDLRKEDREGGGGGEFGDGVEEVEGGTGDGAGGEEDRGNGDGTAVVELKFPGEDDHSDEEEEKEEEEDGMIKPIIRFDKFPAGLSWDQI